MAKRRTRLTNSSDENDIANVISGDTVFTIPYFQRAYRWKTERLRRLEKDILAIVDSDGDEMHFLGAIIVHGRRSNPSDPNVFDVIDGQQRITTLFIYLCAIVKTLCQADEIDEAISLFQKYLVIGRKTSLSSNFKLHSSKDDRAQLNGVFQELIADRAFKERLGTDYRPRFLASTGSQRGNIRNNYLAALRFLKEQVSKEGTDRLRAIYRAILDSMSVVQIDVDDPLNGPKIFDSLNSEQEPMTIGDLVRNEIFSKIVEEQPQVIEEIDETCWQPFYKRFQHNGQNLFDAYFFPYGLTKDPNLRKSEVYGSLKSGWQGITDPADIIAELGTYQDAFIDLVVGTNSQKHPKPVAQRFFNLHAARAPTSTYPFLMQLSNAIKSGGVNATEGIAVLEVVESFLVRRAICGHEPTGLHSVFKRLWTDCVGNPTDTEVTTNIKQHKTVVWPNDDELRQAVQHRSLYGAGVTHYVLLQHDKSLGGDQPSDIPWIEHVLPSKPAKEWFKTFTREQHEQLKDLLANLVPLSGPMNIDVSNAPYAKKRPTFEADSMFKSARALAKENVTWTPKAIARRGKAMADWSVKRWPFS